MDDEKVIAMGCLGLLIMLALPGVALITLVICKILDNMIPPRVIPSPQRPRSSADRAPLS